MLLLYDMGMYEAYQHTQVALAVQNDKLAIAASCAATSAFFARQQTCWLPHSLVVMMLHALL